MERKEPITDCVYVYDVNESAAQFINKNISNEKWERERESGKQETEKDWEMNVMFV